MTPRTITKILILATLAIWIAWDVYTDVTHGALSTISDVVLRATQHSPGLLVVIGILIGHLVYEQRSTPNV